MSTDSPSESNGQRGKRTARKLLLRDIKSAKHDGTTYGKDGQGARQTVLWDTEVSGLGLRVYPSGRKSWVLRFKRGRRRRIVTLGQFGVFSLDEARDFAREKLVHLKTTGEDPFAQPAKAMTISELIPEYLGEKQTQVKASTLRAYGTKLQHVEDHFGGRTVDEVEERDMRRFFVSLTTTAGPTAANQALQQASALFDWAGKKGQRSVKTPNPASGIRPNRTQSRGRKLSSKELQRIGSALEDEEKERPAAADTVAAIRLLALTGARRREITELSWNEVDFEDRCLRLKDSKTGARTIALPTPALALLASISEGVSDGRVFPKGQHEVSYAIQYTWKRVLKRAELKDLRLHDLRHSFVTRGLGANYSSAIVGKLVGHKSFQTTKRYEHLEANQEGLEAAERIGLGIAGDMDGNEGGEVLAFSRPAGFGEKR